MDNKVSQYQRAVTPTIDGGGSSIIRGKILNYSSQTTNLANHRISANNRPTSSSVGGAGGGGSTGGGIGLGSTAGSSGNMAYHRNNPNSVISPRTGLSVPNANNVDITIQGKGNMIPSTNNNPPSSGNQTPGGSQSMSGRSMLNPPIPASMMNSGILEQFNNNISFLPRYDLIPISEELPLDGIIFAKIKNQPDSLVIFRTPDERTRNPERLNLDRRQLEQCPLLEQEQRLRLLNYQNNHIKWISNVENLPNLIFLDLYNNQIQSLEGPLSNVKGLRVLMAGKNKISKIQNLQTLRKLDVLDLHSNDIKVIEGLDGLSDLRVLNLAGNKISIVNQLSTLSSLTELNLRRNRIQYVQGLEKLPALQRVFLSHNAIQSLKDVWCLFEVQYLIELSLDGNPVSEIDPVKYREHVIRSIPTLKHLDLKRITDEDRNGILGYDNPTSDKVPRDVPNKEQPDSNHAVSSEVNPSNNSTLNNLINDTNNNPPAAITVATATGNPKQSAKSTTTTPRHSTPKHAQQQAKEQNDIHEGLHSLQQTKKSFSLDSNGDFVLAAAIADKVLLPEDEEALGEDNGNTNDDMTTRGADYANNNTSDKSQIPHLGDGGSGIALLARAGRINRMQSIFDIEILGPEEKVLVIVGENWEWNAPKRLINAVTEACLLHIRREVLMTKFNVNQMNQLASLKTMRFLYNDFASLKQVEFIPAMYGNNIEHLVIQENPIHQSAPTILRNFMIASMPKLKTFNQTLITSSERQAAEKAYQPFLGLRNKSVKSFMMSSTKLSKQAGEEMSSPSKADSVQTIGGVKFIQSNNNNNTPGMSKNSSQVNITPKPEHKISYEDFSTEFDMMVKEYVAQTINACNTGGSTTSPSHGK